MKLLVPFAFIGLTLAVYENAVTIKVQKMNEVVSSLESTALETTTAVTEVVERAVTIDKTSHAWVKGATRSSVSFLPAKADQCSLHWSLCPNMCNVEYELKYRFVAIRGDIMEEYERFMTSMAEKKDEIIKDLDGKASEIFSWELARNKTSLDLEGLEDAFILELANDIKQAVIINKGLKALKFSVTEISAVITTLSANIQGAYANCQNQAPCMAVPVCKLAASAGESCASIVEKSLDQVDGESVNHMQSGIYLIAPRGLPPKHTLCRNDILGGSYTVFQNRYNGTVDFNRGWADYAEGFGQVAHLNSPDCELGEYWLGNDYIYAIQDGQNALVVDMKRANGAHGVVSYSNFQMGDRRNDYKLLGLGIFKDDVCKLPVGDSFAGSTFKGQSFGGHDIADTKHIGMKFSTFDRDNDLDSERNCASEDSSGWWFNRCSAANLNGVYHGGKYDKSSTGTGEFDDGILWNTWTQNKFEALTVTQMALGVDKGYNNRMCVNDGGTEDDYTYGQSSEIYEYSNYGVHYD